MDGHVKVTNEAQRPQPADPDGDDSWRPGA